ncbi:MULTISPECIES: 1-deoxy-D-xylulose-5-phosphate reductoisomerase [Luteimonas]|uniref:1-deoxy-D-xylulose-5-phosphate reductoisomerase n=1 Tax=Luteimonas TaxID=83614 RepID=UPI000C7A05A8|nr:MULTISPECIES: 1-deoxy-D-xylulose-5-phosphate reductoisomerase [Luteimonas]
MIRRVAVYGATGSIGTSALDVIARHPGRLRASVLAAGSNVDALVALCARHTPDHAVIADPALAAALRDGLRAAGLATEAHAGADALDVLAAGDACDTVIAAIVGAAGLDSTLAAVRSGKRVLLANKESLVLAGALMMQAAREAGAAIVPIDSEHNAIHQCLPPGGDCSGVRRIVLPASGGPFRGRTRASLADVTPALMNKGLELIEAHHLFAMPSSRLDVLVHPQSLVHSLVEFIDGSTLAQLGLPDMRTALAVGLGDPQRIASGVGGLDLLQHGRLDFEPPDLAAFPCLALARAALEAGGTAPALLNAANEVAVSAFLQGRLRFLSIPALVEHTLAALPAAPADSLDVLRDADARARRVAGTALDTATVH